MELWSERYKSAVEEALDKALPAPEAEALNGEVIRAMRYSLLCGGKRIRPVLTLAFCQLCGEDPFKAIPFACAVEMVHTYSLIHDDMPCMDNDDYRRGKPTNHKMYGEDMALLAGDGLLTKAFETALSYSGDPKDAVKAAKLLAHHAGEQGMVGGQCIDLKADGREISLEVLETMDEGKTVALISAACELGCIAGNADEAELEAARRYAKGIGMAFQIRDDILDVLGDSEKLGKNTGMDAAHDKRNYVTLLGVEKAQKLVEVYTQEAVEALSAFPGGPSFLKDFAYSLAGRNF